MKKFFSFTLFTLLSIATLNAQKPDTLAAPRKCEVSIDDVVAVLRSRDMWIFSFDLSAFNNRVYTVSTFVDEYRDGVLQDSDFGWSFGQNKSDISTLGDELADFRRNHALTDDQNVWTRLSKVGLYVVPRNDTVSMVTFSLKDMVTGSVPLNLLPFLDGPQKGQKSSYDIRRFRLDPPKGEVKRIPLLFVGQFWWDDKANFYRFCGEREIAPDLSSEIVGYVKHYFVIGLELTPSKLKPLR